MKLKQKINLPTQKKNNFFTMDFLKNQNAGMNE